jgi:hypothetical protein
MGEGAARWHAIVDLLAEGVDRQAGGGEDVGHLLFEESDAQQEMMGTEVGMLEALGLLLGEDEGPSSSLREPLEHGALPILGLVDCG